MKPHKEVVVITGASAGVGRATVRRFAKAGADIALIARGEAGLAGARADVESVGGRALVLPTDVADPDAVEAAAARAEAELGPIDIWINDAMVTVFAEAINISPAEFKRVTEVDYLGFVYGTQAALRRMLPRDRGTIVQVGSALAYRAIPLQSAYCGAKHAIRGFTDSVRCELLHRKSRVHITMVQMPALNTPQFEWCVDKMAHKSQPVPPIYQPEVAAEAIYFAAHHRRRELYVGGSTAVFIPGNKIAPGVGDRYLGKTGYASQQYDGPPASDRRVNLWQPADDVEDAGAHGTFGARAHQRSFELWAAMRKPWLALAAVASAAGAAALLLRWPRARRALFITLLAIILPLGGAAIADPIIQAPPSSDALTRGLGDGWEVSSSTGSVEAHRRPRTSPAAGFDRRLDEVRREEKR